MTKNFTPLSALHGRNIASVFSFVIFLLLSTGQELSGQALQGTFESKFARYREGQSFTGTQISHWADTVWRGDRVYKQLLLWTSGSVTHMTCEASPLAFGTNSISADRVNLRFVSNVIGDVEPRTWRNPYPATGAARTKVLIGDALQNEPVSGLQAGELVKIWTTIDIPSTTIPGTYTGSISVKSNGQVLKTFTISLLVTNNILPEAAAWGFHLNIRQFPFTLGNMITQAAGWQWNFYDYFSDAWFSRLEPFYKLLVDAGQKDLTVYGFDGAFQKGLTMIKWKFNADNTVSLDFSNFDNYVEKLTLWGFTGKINCFVMNGWKDSYTYPDGTKEDINSIGYYTNLEDINPHWDKRIPNKADGAATSEFSIRWKSFLRQFREHLNQKGWFNRTILSFGETTLVNDLKSVYLPLIEGDHSGWKVSCTGSKADDELAGKLYNYYLPLEEAADKNPVSPENVFAFYTGSNGTVPNSFLTTENNPAEMTWLAWYAKNKGFNGYARWAYDFWKNTEVTNMQDDASTAGDCELVYRSSNLAATTQPISSIRLELLRDGIQDYEKAKILGNNSGPLQNMIAQFTDDSGTRSLALVVKGQSVIKKLAAACTYTLNPPESSVGAAASTEATKGNFTVTVATGTNCSWTPTKTAEWITDVAKTAVANQNAAWTVTYSFAENTGAARTAAITVGNQTHTVNQAATPCTYTLNPPESSVGAAASTETTKGNFTVTVATGTNCSWTPTKTAEWITDVAKTAVANQNAAWTVTYSFAENTGAARTAAITVGNQTHTVNQAATPCTYTLNPPESSVGAAASTEATKGNFTVTVATGTNCSWTPTKTAEWITDVAKTAVANQNAAWTVTYSFAENTGAARTAAITVGNQTHTVNQAATTCTYILNPLQADVGAAASTEATKGNFTVTVATGTNCSWTPVKTAEWITDVAKTAVANQNAAWTITYSFAENTGAARTAAITVGNQTHTVNQAATPCTYILNPLQADIGAAASTEATKGNFTVTVATGTNCSWTPTKTAEWITDVTKTAVANQNAAWTVTYSFAENTGAARTAAITVGNQTHTVNQAATPCTYILNPLQAEVGAAASTEATKGNFTVTVATGTNCSWTPVKTAEWITDVTKTAVANQNAAWTVTYSFAENTGAARTAAITVGNQTHTVNQAATPCTYTLNPPESSVGAAASTEATKGNFTVTVATGTNCSWTPTKTAEWITDVAKTAVANQNAAWTVTYSFAENTGAARTAAITVGNQTHTVNQAATSCTYILNPLQADVGAAASTETTKGNFTVTVATGTNCSWTPTKTAEWITDVAKTAVANQNAAWTVTYSFAENTGAARTAAITVGNQTHTVNQAATPCTYTLNPPESSVGAAASTEATKGNFTVTVATGTNCSWTPTKTAEWITNLTKAPTAGQDGTRTVTYSYTANTTPNERRAIITVGDKTHTVIQAGTIIASNSKNGYLPGHLTCYPNPVAANFVHVAGLNEPIRNAFLLTCSGQKIELTVLSEEKIDLSNVSPGFYIIVVNETAEFKVIKSH